ncbi:hypothetical protein [Marimonas arenosa]|uniref:DUF998 domain-containing protein n=1 Tax=Marimonas arenosa TaxID=1795305 RepID=A0AAE3WDF8_9RHOB|nr:hypothetical protein [Marimonas arenosa]MDQ2090672.1 hypothetical protein [Marimonas arenosa]
MKPQEMSRRQLERTASHHEEAMNRLRRSIGLIGVGLPILLLAGVALFGVAMQDSISEFFFTPMREVFVLTLTGIGVFLINYYGHDPERGDLLTDWRVSTTAGVTALGVALIPTFCGPEACYRPLSLLDGLISSDMLQSALHFGSAGLFLTALAVMCLKLFTKTDRASPGRHKLRRNRLYRACGWTIVAMVAGLFVFKLLLRDIGRSWDAAWHFTFWAESVAVWAFGIAWLVKGEAMARTLTFLHGRD